MCAGVSKRIAAVVFIGMLCLVFLKSGSYMEIRRLAELLRQDAEASESEDVLTMDRLETEFSSMADGSSSPLSRVTPGRFFKNCSAFR